MIYDYRITRVVFPVGDYAECLRLVMADQRRVGIMFNKANGGVIEIGISQFNVICGGFTAFVAPTPLSILYKDFGDVVKQEFWGVIQGTNGTIQILETLRLS